MGENCVVAISRDGQFSLAEAREVLPVMKKITQTYSASVEEKISHLESIDTSQVERITELESAINEEIKQWHIKVKKLGGQPKGLWLIDFDCGDGYFCWKYPEAELLYWHGYDEGYTNRITVEEWAQKTQRGVHQCSNGDLNSPLHNSSF